jgi:nicotinamidase-related amidase
MKAIIVVDVLNGFCVSGHLASPRLARVVPGIRTYLERELASGARAIFLADTHTPDDLEFAMFPPHCVVGTEEAQIVPELREIAARSDVVRKTRYSGFYGTDLDQRLAALAPDVVEVVGVCTDICVMHTVADLRNRDYRVVVHRDLVETYDAPGHDGDRINEFALAHMRDVLGASLE